MPIILSIIFFGLLLAYANGANDNFKGVATLFGSGTTSYKRTLYWATITTFLGSFAALVLAKELLVSFSGKGLVPDSVVGTQSFSLAIALAAALTILLATRLGLPVSTTHALTGALVGAGWLASDTGVNLMKLGKSFFLPLALSPVLAILATVVLYPVFTWTRTRLAVSKETCLCVGTEVAGVVPAGMNKNEATAFFQEQTITTVGVGTKTVCQERYFGSMFGLDAQTVLDTLHYLSAGSVSFARGLNDTPKISALLLVGNAISPNLAILGVALAMASGGMINSRKVAETLSHRATDMNSGQGFTANLVTSVIVILASKLSLPVSTTHVSCGALFGIGTVTRQAHWKTIATILLAWLTTLPLAAALGAVGFLVIKNFI